MFSHRHNLFGKKKYVKSACSHIKKLQNRCTFSIYKYFEHSEHDYMGSSMGMDKELTEKIKGRAGTGDIIMEVCYRPAKQEDRVDEAVRSNIMFTNPGPHRGL